MTTAILPAMLGVVAGAGITLAGARWVQTFLYGVSASDVTTITGTALSLMAIAVIAAWPSARRAATIDPVLALATD